MMKEGRPSLRLIIILLWIPVIPFVLIYLSICLAIIGSAIRHLLGKTDLIEDLAMAYNDELIKVTWLGYHVFWLFVISLFV